MKNIKLTNVIYTKTWLLQIAHPCFVFICNLNSCISEGKAKDIIFEVMIQSEIFDRHDLLAELWDKFNSRNKDLKKQVGLFEIENIDKSSIITIESKRIL